MLYSIGKHFLTFKSIRLSIKIHLDVLITVLVLVPKNNIVITLFL
jgi:hypothetical protein